MKNRRIIRIGGAALLLAALLCGCAGTVPEETTVSTAPTAGQIVTAPKLGEKMPDFTVTTTEGEQITLYEVLAEKKLVVLNFWFTTCSWCQKEFPVLELAYQRYREDVEVLALDPLDTAQEVAAFAQSHSLTMPLAACPNSLATGLGIRSYPTSVFIDRDGIICLIHAGAITDVQVFYDAFETFTAEDYQRKTYNSITELTR